MNSTHRTSNWAHKLSRPVKIYSGPRLETLADVRTFILDELPVARQGQSTWRHITAELLAAAESTSADTRGITRSLEIVVMLEDRRSRQRGST